MKARCTSLLVLLMTVYCSLFTVNTSVAFSKEEMNSVFASLLTKTNEMGATPISISSVATSPTCWGGSNGSINITVAGGSPPYSYLWSTGVTTEDISGLVAGNYSVTVHDITGQIAVSTITVNPAVQTVGYLTCNRVCFGVCNGIIDLTILTAGTYTYHWSANANGATTQDVTGLCAGVYTVTVTNANGCTKLFAGQILSWPGMTLSSTKVDLVCNNVCNGSIDLSVTGGTSPFSYHWSNGATTQDVSNLCAGTYSVTVTDFCGCIIVFEVAFVQP